MVNFFYDCYTILNKVYGEKAYVKQAINGTLIEEKNRAAIIKTCYGVLDKDIELSYYIKVCTEKTPKLPIRTILKIGMYCIKYLGKKPYAVTQNAVELTKKLGKGGASGFVNFFLRKFSAETPKLPDDFIENLSVSYSYPSFAIKRLLNGYGKEKTLEILNNIDKCPTDNCLVFYDTDGKRYLQNLNVSFTETPFNNVFRVNGFVRNCDYDAGVYTFQALCSVAICEAVEPCDKLLDCCAAPGGKSVRLSYKCKEITAWDIHAHRVNLIDEYSARMGVKNVTTSIKDAKEYDKALYETFDAVLCDAPCSGLGVVCGNPDIKINRTDADVVSLCKEQLAILNTVKNYVKKGGCLYYSTCSVLPDENYGTVKRFLSENDDFEICPLKSPLPHDDIYGTKLFADSSSGAFGFYVAKIRKKL